MFKNPDFSSLGLGSQSATSRDAWLAELKKETGKSFEDLYNTTMEQIQLKPLYTEMDYEGMTHLDYMAGVPPFLRGPYSIVVTWQQAKKGCLLPLTLLLTVVMTPTILA